MRGGFAVVGALAGALALMATAGCSTDTAKADSPKGSAAAPTSAKPTVSAATIAIEPANGATDVKTTGAVKVAATGGKLTSVKVTGPDGVEVPGALTSDATGWAPSGNLKI
ncbi:Ig-like domain-containing protein, partial [Kitasatospora cheerisanensis]|uniref:Ig-like domain-containing protein n=1 Tax=Kitasatospora cheerisanensis TaxID=81942 RepID=UPI00056B0AC3